MPGDDVKTILDRLDRLENNNREDHSKIFDELGALKIARAVSVTKDECATCKSEQDAKRGWPPGVTITISIIVGIMSVMGTLLAVAKW